jgi:hypothetical protein
MPSSLQLFSSIEHHHATYKVLSIRQFIASIELAPWAKRYIQIILARSILPLLQGRWVETSLSSDNIFIVCAIDGNVPTPLFDRLFVSTRFGESVSPPKLYQHPAPAIKALGILLAEVELGDRLEGIYQTMGPQRPFLAEDLLKHCSRRLPDTTGVLQSIGFCIAKQSFWKYRALLSHGNPQHDPNFV